jgi:hypothetical protein
VTSERYCGNGRYCDEGHYCTGDGHCRSHAADRALKELEASIAEMQRAAEEAARRAKEEAEAAERALREEERKRAEAASHGGQAPDCSTITGLPGDSSGPNNCGKNTPQSPPARDPNRRPTETQRTPPQQPRRVVMLPPPPCAACDALNAAGEILPQFGQLLADAEREINSPDIAPPEQWLTEPVKDTPASRTDTPVGASDNDASGAPGADTTPGRRLPDLLTFEDPFQLDEEAERDYAEVCKEAAAEFLSGKDNPIQTAKKKIRDLKKQGNSIVDTARHPIEHLKQEVQDYINKKLEKLDYHNYFDTLKEQILKAETKNRQEELKSFEEKKHKKCDESAYKYFEDRLKEAEHDPDGGAQ